MSPGPYGYHGRSVNRLLTGLGYLLVFLMGSTSTAAAASSVGDFSYGQLGSASVGMRGCGTNAAAEPAIRISPESNVFLGSELGLGAGSQLWRGLGSPGGPGADGCGLEFRGEPNPGTIAGGADIDLAIAPDRGADGTRTLYVASLNGASVSVAHSSDNGQTFAGTSVQNGLPLDDREWIAAFGARGSLLTFTDQLTRNIDVLRSTDGGASYGQISQAIPSGDYRAAANQIGNLAIDPARGTAYQSFAAPSAPSGQTNNEVFVGVSTDRGASFTDQPIPCSTAGGGVDHNFPNVAVDGSTGRVWAAWSDDTNVISAVSSDGGRTWKCSGPVSTRSAHAVFPWLAARNGGADLVFYATPDTGAAGTWSVQFAQNVAGTPGGWAAPQQLMSVHTGSVCEAGASCSSQRQLLDDFGVDIDPAGWAHIAYSHDAPDLGGQGSYTGYAVQTGGVALSPAGSAGTSASPGTAAPGTAGRPPTGAPSSRATCKSRRIIVIRVSHPPRSRLRSVAVYVNGHRVRHGRSAARVRIDLRSRPGSTVRVVLVARVQRGGHTVRVSTRRTYHLCQRRRPRRAQR